MSEEKKNEAVKSAEMLKRLEAREERLRLATIVQTSPELKELIESEMAEGLKATIAFEAATTMLKRHQERLWKAIFENHPELREFEARLTKDNNVQVIGLRSPNLRYSHDQEGA